MAISNKGPFTTASSAFEAHVVQQPHQDRTQGKATCPFESRATQEGGTH